MNDPFGGEKEQDRIRVRFKPTHFNTPSTLELKKDVDFTERDAECIVEIWQRLAPAKSERDPAEMLEALGARVYAENTTWTWERLVRTPAQACRAQGWTLAGGVDAGEGAGSGIVR